MSREHWGRYQGVKTGLSLQTVRQIIQERGQTDPDRPLGEQIVPGVFRYQGVIYSTREQPWRILR